ncbi:MAG: hypothetical protein ACKPFK_30495 [Dolichospermum sp.]
MTHPIYTAKFLLNKGITYSKRIAKELGISPEGDRRLIQSWVDEIVEHQSVMAWADTVVEPEVTTATIGFDADSYEGLTQPYVVLVDGAVVHRTTTYQQAVRHCQWQGYNLLDSQSLAQDELKVELEMQATAAESAIQVLEQVEDEGCIKFIVQSGENFYTVTPAHPLPNERCECGDTHFRGSECKHQKAVKNKIAAKISFISPPDFGYYEAIVDEDIHNIIGTIEYHSDRDCDQPWWSVRMAKEKSEIFASYEEAEQFIKDKYVEDYFADGRGSGRISEPVETGYQIEDTYYQDGRGSQYLVKLHGSFAGYIWLNNDCWTLNGVDFEDDWRPVAKELAKLTKHLVAA